MKIKLRYSKVYYSSLFIWNFLFTVTWFTTLQYRSDHYYLPYVFVWKLIRFFLTLKIWKDLKTGTNRDLKVVFGILVIGSISWYFSQNEFLYPLLWFAAAAKNTEIKKSIQYLWYSQIAAVGITIFGSLAGILENRVMAGNGIVRRYTLGFIHPNTLGAFLMQLVLLTFYLYARQSARKVYFIAALCFMIAWRIACSRTTTFVLVIFFMFSALYYITVKRNKKLQSFLGILLQRTGDIVKVSLGVSLAAICGLLNQFDMADTLGVRISQAKLYFNYYGVTLWGQPLIMGYETNEYYNGLFTLDNAYIYLFLAFGGIVSILFLFFYFQRLKRARVENDHIVLIILVLYGIVGITETTMIRFGMNFSLIFLAEVLWKDFDKQTLSNGQRVRIRLKMRSGYGMPEKPTLPESECDQDGSLHAKF